MTRRGSGPAVVDVADLCGDWIVHVRELEAVGVSRRTAFHRCRPGGPWRTLLPGVIVLHNGPTTRDDRRRAALVYVRQPAVLTGLDALELHGLTRIPRATGPVHLLIPAERRRTGAGRVLAERTERLPEPVHSSMPLAPVARAVLDFARRSRDRNHVRSAIAEVVQRGLAEPATLRRELAAGTSRGSALPRAVLAEVSDGVRSVAEAQARRLVAGAGLGAPLWNARVVDAAGRFVAVPDAWFDDVALAWEIDSHEFHLGPAEHERTVRRRSEMMAQGIVVLQTLPQHLRTRPDAVVEELRRVHATAAARPRPPLTAHPA
ncbi:hypothetical protein PSU4_34220 [Pseudonocardia sulfidoxydans NBRC 16205]|uniref:DUF559 domain-containing protein n=1 Tax=Pseudonocardia sulfidoxydans NBRC 16205 TaxID=1223511 RepID=A0A511DN15_9PSEU|nr:hypothetical protein [Pseudonocardia sulfidoxydans]GEL24468.1 hypothetical protein PSU4_34220 [Pseudonocardia sulfidoxydans NBRC 16205]